MLKLTLSLLAVFVSLSTVAAQDMQPTCHECPGTYIPNQELQAYAQRAITNHLLDQQVRAVDVGHSNLDVGIVYRTKLDGPAPNSVAEHDQVSELYHVIEGTATLETGPDLVGKKRRQGGVMALNGPGNDASSIENGVSHNLKEGDVIIIPAGTGHLFTHIDDHILYLIVRVDPDKVTPHKDEAASKAYLASDPKKPSR